MDGARALPAPLRPAPVRPALAPLRARDIVTFVAMVLGMFMAILDIQIVSSSLAQIQAGVVYVNRAAELVAAKVSTQPHSHEPHMLDTLRAFDAVAYELAGVASQGFG